MVIGAGTAGAAAARACARRGLSVQCLDKRPLGEAGARWVNGVPAWAFAEAGLPLPRGRERRHDGGRFHLIAGWGPQRTTIDARGLFEVDMRALVERLQGDAAAAGAQLRGGVAVRTVAPLGPGARVETDQGTLTARVVIDASGLRSPLRPAAVPAGELCVAAQEVRGITDPGAAEAWCRAQGAQVGDTVCFTGMAGGYSIINVRVSLGDDHHVGILTGSIPGDGHPSGVSLLQDFVRSQPWVGALDFGGSRAIPLAPPLDALADGPVARIGDAGNQVFASHGSGIAAGLIAAAQLAEVLAQGGSPWQWNVQWQRSWGAHLLPANHFARFSRTIALDELRHLTESGLMTERLSQQALFQHPTRPSVRDLPRVLRGAWRARTIARRMLPVATTLLKLERHQRAYPAQPAALNSWTERRRSLLDLGES